MSGIKKNMGDIQRAVQILAGTYDKDLISFEVAQIITVDTSNWTCQAKLVSSTAQNIITNIQLSAEQASNGFIQVPKEKSNVILATTFRNEIYVFMCSEIDALVFHQLNSDGKTYEEFVINCNSSTKLPLGITISDGSTNGIAMNSAGTIQVNDGTFGGIVKLVDPNNSNAGVLARLNNIEAWINAFSGSAGMFATHTHECTAFSSPGGPPIVIPKPNAQPTSTPPPTTAPPTIQQTQRSDLENADVTQGPKTTNS